jgi:hypothetical protein
VIEDLVHEIRFNALSPGASDGGNPLRAGIKSRSELSGSALEVVQVSFEGGDDFGDRRRAAAAESVHQSEWVDQ